MWLINRHDDLVWITGGAVLGYATLLAFFLGAPVAPFSLFMVLLLESPHVFATATRSYLDGEERRRQGAFLLLVIPLCLIGPFMLWLGLGTAFFTIAVLWLHFHIAKQHVGFVMLYKRKAGEVDDIKLDKYFLLGSLTLPLILFVFRDHLSQKVILVTIFIYAAAALWYGLRQFERRRSVTRQKLLLMGLVIPLQWLAFGFATTPAGGGIRTAGIVITFCHSMQYHRLMRLYHTTERRERPESKKLWHTLGGYLFVILSLNIVLYVLPGLATGGDVMIAAVWGLSFQHYLLDGRIWKTKDYPIFRKALGLERAA